MDDDRKCPPFSGSVDLDAVFAADARGDDLVKAVEEATAHIEPPAELDGKLKAELVEIAESEGVEIAPNATKTEIVEAIEARRAADSLPADTIGGEPAA